MLALDCANGVIHRHQPLRYTEQLPQAEIAENMCTTFRPAGAGASDFWYDFASVLGDLKDG
jgi:hypothetical protein